MKLWEVLKALEENPKKKFKTEDGNSKMSASNSGYLYLDRYDSDGKWICRDTGGGGFSGNFLAQYTDDWQEVKQPVTWQEALEAWANHKRVHCIAIDGKKWTYEWKESERGELVACEDDWGVSPEEIKLGTWYIEN